MILNLHGYMGKAENTNYRILTEAGYEVTSLQFTYENTDPEKILAALNNEIAINRDEVDLITATSFGSFFGKILSNKYHIPFIATNPCLRPDISLAAVDPTYLKSVSNCKFILDNLELNRRYGFRNDTFIIGNNDNVIDHRITFQEALRSTIHIVEGGHKLDENVYKNLILSEVVKYV